MISTPTRGHSPCNYLPPPPRASRSPKCPWQAATPPFLWPTHPTRKDRIAAVKVVVVAEVRIEGKVQQTLLTCVGAGVRVDYARYCVYVRVCISKMRTTIDYSRGTDGALV